MAQLAIHAYLIFRLSCVSNFMSIILNESITMSTGKMAKRSCDISIPSLQNNVAIDNFELNSLPEMLILDFFCGADIIWKQRILYT